MRSLDSGDPHLPELLEAVPALVAVTRPDDGRIVYANSHWMQFVGFRPDAGLTTIHGVYEDPNERDRLVAAVRERGSVEGFEAAFRHADGTRRIGRLTARTVLWDGEPAVLTVTTDMTEQRRAEEAMVAAIEDLAAVLDAMRNAVVTMDGDGEIRTFNRAAEDVFGYAAGEVVGGPVTALMTPGDAGAHQNHVEHYKNTGRGAVIGRGREVLARRKDGTTFPAHLSVAEMPPTGGGGRRFVGSLFDLTDMKRGERALVEAKLNAESATRAKSRFLAVLNHELRTPLNAIIGFAQLLEMALERPDPRRDAVQYARHVRDNGETLLRMLNDMMEYAHLEYGRASITPDEVFVGDVFDAAVSMVRKRAGDKGIVLQVDAHDRHTVVYGERSGLIQILANLLDNAVKFTPAGGTVALTSRRLRDGTMEFEVADTGCGIEEAMLERIFIPFDTDTPLLTRPHDGVGIGLPIVKHLVDLHKGTIRVTSRPGAGTTVTVTLPPPLPQ